jgi:4-amino-4-deoxy-L-arabinose transferase-like glycosyltransferase
VTGVQTCALPISWFVAQTWIEGPGFLKGFFLKHNLSRFEGSMEGHGGNYFYYLPVVLISLLPHTGLLIHALGRLGSLWGNSLLRFGMLWFLMVLVLFSFSGTKLPHYVYYGYGGLVLVLAASAQASRNRWLILLPGIGLYSLLFLAPELLGLAMPSMKPDDRLLATSLSDSFDTRYRIGLGIGLGISLALLTARWRLAISQHVNGLLSGIAIAGFVMPSVGHLLQAPVKQAGLIAGTLSGGLVMYGMHNPSFQTYAKRQVRRGMPTSGDVALTRESKVASLGAHDVLFRDRGVVLLRMR